jgi:single-strand DNA-binding protein
MNRATLYGRLAHTPELKKLPNGNSVATMSLATNHVYKDQQGNKVESTDWFNLVSYGKQAETLAQYCEGGQQMLFEGRIVTRSWDDKTTGEKRYRTEIIISEFEFGAKSQSREAKQGQGEAKASKTKEVVGRWYDGDVATIDYDDNVNIDDIPF